LIWRHCVERYQYSLKLKRIGAEEIGQIADFTRTLVSLGYGQFQELDADSNGMALSVRADYDPGAGAAVFRRMYLDVLAKQYSLNRPPTRHWKNWRKRTTGAISELLPARTLPVNAHERLEVMVGTTTKVFRPHVLLSAHRI